MEVVKKNTIKRKEKVSKTTSPFLQLLKNYATFYKEHLRKKHIIWYVVSLAIFFVCLVLFISSSDVSTSIEQMTQNTQTVQFNAWEVLLKQNIPIVFLIIFAGITPFLYLPVLGISVSYILAGSIASLFATTSHTGDLVFMTISAIIQIFAYALAMATGMEYCRCSTKKFRYQQSGGITSIDVKSRYYELKKNEKKLEEIAKKKEQKQEKRETFNIKIPYLYLVISFVICMIFVAVAAIIAAI